MATAPSAPPNAPSEPAAMRAGSRGWAQVLRPAGTAPTAAAPAMERQCAWSQQEHARTQQQQQLRQLWPQQEDGGQRQQEQHGIWGPPDGAGASVFMPAVAAQPAELHAYFRGEIPEWRPQRTAPCAGGRQQQQPNQPFGPPVNVDPHAWSGPPPPPYAPGNAPPPQNQERLAASMPPYRPMQHPYWNGAPGGEGPLPAQQPCPQQRQQRYCPPSMPEHHQQQPWLRQNTSSYHLYGPPNFQPFRGHAGRSPLSAGLTYPPPSQLRGQQRPHNSHGPQHPGAPPRPEVHRNDSAEADRVARKLRDRICEALPPYLVDVVLRGPPGDYYDDEESGSTQSSQDSDDDHDAEEDEPSSSRSCCLRFAESQRESSWDFSTANVEAHKKAAAAYAAVAAAARAAAAPATAQPKWMPMNATVSSSTFSTESLQHLVEVAARAAAAGSTAAFPPPKPKPVIASARDRSRTGHRGIWRWLNQALDDRLLLDVPPREEPEETLGLPSLLRCEPGVVTQSQLARRQHPVRERQRVRHRARYTRSALEWCNQETLVPMPLTRREATLPQQPFDTSAADPLIVERIKKMHSLKFSTRHRP